MLNVKFLVICKKIIELIFLKLFYYIFLFKNVIYDFPSMLQNIFNLIFQKFQIIK